MVGLSTPGAQSFPEGTIHHAVSACDLETVRALVEEGLRQEKLAERMYASGLRAPAPAAYVDDVERGIEPIHIAAGLSCANPQDQTDLIEYLFENGANPNAYNAEDGLSPLHIAAELNNVAVVSLLLDNGADATAEDPRAMTALHLAANSGHTETVEVLVSKAPGCVSQRRCKGNTALHYAAAHGHFATSVALLEGGAKPNSRNNMGATPLHFAAGRGYKNIVEALVELGAYLDEKQNDGCTPLHFAAMEGHLDVLEVLMQNHAQLETKTEFGSTALHCAAERGFMEILVALLEYGADVNAMQNSGNTPLMYAAAKGHEKVVRTLLGAQANPNHSGDNGSTPVHRAVANDMISIVGILLEAGADLNRPTVSGETPLFHAAAQGNLDMVQFLLEQGAEVNGHVNNGGDTPLHLACTQGNKQVVMALIEHGARLDVVNEEGFNPLQKGQYKLHEEIPNYLASCVDEEGRTLLWSLVSEMAAQEHPPHRVVALRVLISDMLDYKSDPNAEVQGVSVLDAALAPGGSFDYDTVKMLVDTGAACDRGFPLNRVVKELTGCRDDPEREEFLLDCIELLAPEVDVNANAEGNTPLMIAINAHHARAVHRLAQAGADINSGNIIGKLCKQLRNLSEEPGQEERLQFLGESIITVVEAGADVNASAGKMLNPIRQGPARTLADRYPGNSCIEHCIAAGHESACKAIISHGCDLSLNHMLNKIVEEMCEIDPNRTPPDDARNPSTARYGTGRMEFLREIFHEMVAQPDTQLDDEWEGKTPLRRAVEDVHDDLPFGQEAVSALLEAGADPNKNHVFFWTVHNLCHLNPASGPRHEALFKIVKMLVSKKDEEGQPLVDVNLAYDNQTPLALSWTAGNQQVVELLTTNGAKLGASTLYDVMAALIKDPDDEFSNRISVSIIADINHRRLNKKTPGASIDYQRNGKTPLILGIMARHEGLVLGEHGLFAAGADANICAPFNFCLEELRSCAPEDKDFLEKVAVYLLDREADVDAGNKRGFRQAVAARSYIAFMLVQERKAVHNDLFDVLSEAVAEQDEEQRDYLERLAMALIASSVGVKIVRDNETALTLSIMSDNIRFIEMLLEKKCNAHDAYPFHKALKEMPKAKHNLPRLEFLQSVLDKLLQHTDGINEVHAGDTPLTCGIKCDARTFTYKLLNLSELDYSLCGPLDVALNQVNMLGVDAEGELEQQDRMDFLYDVIFSLISVTDMTSGSETLIKAINTGRADLVKRMVDAGADVNFLVPLAHCLNVTISPDASAERQHEMTKMAKLLLVNGANPNVAVGAEQIPALTVAARSGDLDLTSQMIMHNPNLDSFDDLDQEGRPALHRFLYWLKETDPANTDQVLFWEACLQVLIKHVGTESLNTLVNGYSPLDVALMTNNSVVCSALLHRGASFGPSALVDTLKELNSEALSADKRAFLEQTACELISNGADVNQAVGSQTPLELVLAACSVPVFQKMVDNGLELCAKDQHGLTVAQQIASGLSTVQDEHLESFLSDAAVALAPKEPSVFHEVVDATHGSVAGSKAALRLIEEAGIDLSTARESDGATPLHCAALSGTTDVLRVLLSQDASVNAQNKFGQTSLAHAASVGSLDCVVMLLDARADPSIQGGQFLTQMSPLHEAALVGDPDICQVLLDADAPVNAPAYWKRTALHLAVVGGAQGEDSGRLPCVRVLIDAGCDVNATDLDDETGLSYAVERNYDSISELLLLKGADPCGADIHGDTPVHHCVENHNNEIFRSLISSKPHELQVLGLLAPVIRAGFRPGLEPLAQPCGEITTADSLSGMIARANVGGWLAPLWNACYFGQTGTAEALLNQLIDTDLKDHAGFSLLHRLVHWGGEAHVGFISTLLRRGASPDVRDRNNWTPLQVAARLGNMAAVRALKAGGAIASEEDIAQSKAAGDAGVALLTGELANEPSIHDRASVDNARAWCSANNAKFLDTSFRPNLKSLVDVPDNTRLPGRYHDVEWVRAGEACSGSFLGAFDVTAGPLGDPFFIATLPDDPGSAFPDAEASAHGVYQVQVQYMNQEHTVMVDDFVPAIDGKPISACSASGMMWPLIYEKACAKVAGSYQALSALRHGEARVPPESQIRLPESVTSSSRREHEVHKFVAPCLAAAVAGGFELAPFAEYFSEVQQPEHALDGVSRPMATVGTFDLMDFSLRAPTKIVKVNVNTTICAECTYSQATSGDCNVAVFVAEVTADKWRMIRGSVSCLGQTSVVVEASLEATGNPYVVFVGTPNNRTYQEQELTLDILSDQQVEISDA